MAGSSPLQFLLVEDDDSHAELVMLAMAENQITNTIDRVADGEQALAYLRQEGEFSNKTRPDVVLLDLKLPKVDGLEVLDILKKDEVLQVIPVVILTTSANEADRAKAYHSHANSYLAKPVDFEKFHQMIKDLKFYWAAWNQPPVVGR